MLEQHRVELERLLDGGRVHVAGGDALLLDAAPAVAFAAAVFLEIELIVVVLTEARHGRERFLDALEKMQQRFAIVRQVQLGTEPHVDVEIFTKRAKRVSHTISHGTPNSPTDSPSYLSVDQPTGV